VDQLREAYKSRRILLFVGAGVSMSLGLPSWRELIGHMAEELDYDPEIFKTYGSDLTLAEFHRIKTGTIGPLRSWMDRAWHSDYVDIKNSRVHQLIVQAGLDLIYTTNYDRWLEFAFDHYSVPYTKVAKAGDLLHVSPEKTQIVKFHGDFDDDASIVLDESSYFRRLQFETPLDIKLRSDLLGRSVVFIGYSLNDINIRYLLFRLANLWNGSSVAAAQPKSYLFSHRPNPIQEAVLKQWNIEMISSNIDQPESALIGFLEDLCN
jgi:hypothetical protein